jgi:hypothetical protein
MTNFSVPVMVPSMRQMAAWYAGQPLYRSSSFGLR